MVDPLFVGIDILKKCCPLVVVLVFSSFQWCWLSLYLFHAFQWFQCFDAIPILVVTRCHWGFGYCFGLVFDWFMDVLSCEP